MPMQRMGLLCKCDYIITQNVWIQNYGTSETHSASRMAVMFAMSGRKCERMCVRSTFCPFMIMQRESKCDDVHKKSKCDVHKESKCDDVRIP